VTGAVGALARAPGTGRARAPAAARGSRPGDRLRPGHALWEGEVWHGRSTPRRHVFRLSLFMTAHGSGRADLDGIEAVLRARLAVPAAAGALPPRVTTWAMRAVPLDDAARARDRAAGGAGLHARPGTVLLLTHLQPVSASASIPCPSTSCLGPTDDRGEAYPAAVRPGGEQHALERAAQSTPWTARGLGRAPLRVRDAEAASTSRRSCRMEQRYRFRFALGPDDRLAHREGQQSKDGRNRSSRARLSPDSALPFERAVPCGACIAAAPVHDRPA
jgi:hypothetical protein